MEEVPKQNESEETIDEGVEGTDEEIRKQLEKSKPFDMDEFLKNQGMSDEKVKELKLDKFGQIITKSDRGYINEKGEFIRGKSVDNAPTLEKKDLPDHLL